MHTTRLPTAAGCTLHTAGQDWDAVRVPRSVGLAAMEILGARCGAVVEDSLSSAVYFFTPVGTSAAWTAENTRALGAGSAVTIPPARRTEGPGVYWRMCPGENGWLTDPRALEAALGDAFGPRVGAQREAGAEA
ncbi:hypothetical protein [Streptomyces sp. NPDC018693]|uniref:hypothetical protein n=1 Tax=unclassified Streptomyces TaxID=2593676 RepID=UPI0037ACBF63